MRDLTPYLNALLAGVIYPVMGIAGGLLGAAATLRGLLAREPSALFAALSLLDRAHALLGALPPLHSAIRLF